MSEITKTFVLGDQVRLKSGGPVMAVNNFDKTLNLSGPSYFNGRVDCSWFDSKGDLKSARFHQDALEKVE